MADKTELPATIAEALPVIIQPEDVLAAAQHAAQILIKTVDQTAMVVKLKREGKMTKYLRLEAWGILGSFARSFYGGVVAPKTYEATPIIEDGAAIGWRARADALCRDAVIAGAEAVVMRTEKQWTSKPDFQLASMAQTRAAAKAMRNALGWIVALASKADYATTPAEEMEDEAAEPARPKVKEIPAEEPEGPPPDMEGPPTDMYIYILTKIEDATTPADLKPIPAEISQSGLKDDEQLTLKQHYNRKQQELSRKSH
jgi:hypothetical protein